MSVNFNEIDTEEKAYLLGLIYSDGCIAKDIPQKRKITIALCEEDRDLLVDIANRFSLCSPTYIKPQENRYSNNGQYKIHLYKEFWEPIYNLNMKETLPNINNCLINHFIRGIFDGDGCISIDKRTLVYKFVSGTFYILFNKLEHAQIVQDIICKNTSVNPTKIVGIKTHTEFVYRIRWSGSKNIIKIRDWIYNNSSISLSRKKNKFYEIVSSRDLPS